MERFMLTQGADLRWAVYAYKLGIAFVDHNHDRKHPLAGRCGKFRP